MRLIQFITFLQAALHVSGVDTHHQERILLIAFNQYQQLYLQLYELLMMGVNTRNMQSCLQKCNKLNKSHIFGQLNSIHDARSHVYKIPCIPWNARFLFQIKEESVWKYTMNKVDGIKTQIFNNHGTHITFFYYQNFSLAK